MAHLTILHIAFVHKTQPFIVRKPMNPQILQHHMAIAEVHRHFYPYFSHPPLLKSASSLSSVLTSVSQASSRTLASSTEGRTTSIIESLSQFRYTFRLMLKRFAKKEKKCLDVSHYNQSPFSRSTGAIFSITSTFSRFTSSSRN